jgi:hypothetical protein
MTRKSIAPVLGISMSTFFLTVNNPIPFHLRIEVGGFHAQDSTLHKVLQMLYPEESIQFISKPHLEEIETYVLFYSCPYGEEEVSLLKEGFHRAKQLLNHPQFKLETHVFMIFYRDLKVDFPERKLQREKVMSEMITEEILHQELGIHRERIHVAHGFGIHDLQETLRELTGTSFYFEVI